MTAAYEVHKAMKTLLTADTQLTGLVQGIYDEAPESPVFPYVIVGDITASVDNMFRLDGRDMTATVHIFSQYEGFKEAYEIQDRIEAVLNHANLPLDTLEPILCQFEFSAALRDPDGITRHVPVRFRVMVSQ